MNPRSPLQEEPSFVQHLGAWLGWCLSVARKSPLLVLAIVFVGYLYLWPSPENTAPQFMDEEGDDPALAPPADTPPGTGPIFACVRAFDADVLRSPWRAVYLGVELPPEGRQLTVVVTERWHELSEAHKEDMVRQVVDLWVRNGRAQGILGSPDELERVSFRQDSPQRTVAEWRPASGPTVFTLS